MKQTAERDVGSAKSNKKGNVRMSVELSHEQYSDLIAQSKKLFGQPQISDFVRIAITNQINRIRKEMPDLVVNQ